jgi:hypothetical protein
MTSITYPPDAGADIYLLTVRGTPTTGSGTTARDLHNATAGDPGGVAGAKAAGDLSHNVFLPTDGADPGLLFVDTWNSPAGFAGFFSDPQVLQGAAALWADRDATFWMPAAGFGSYRLPVPSGATVGAIGLMRAPVSSLKAAESAFRADAASKINAERQVGLIAHELWVPVPMPGSEPVAEVLGVDTWIDAAAMDTWYAQAEYPQLAPVFTGAPVTSAWKPAGTDWIEW